MRLNVNALNGRVGQNYNQQLVASDDVGNLLPAPVIFTALGIVPPGLTLTPGGVLFGTPNAPMMGVDCQIMVVSAGGPPSYAMFRFDIAPTAAVAIATVVPATKRLSDFWKVVIAIVSTLTVVGIVLFMYYLKDDVSELEDGLSRTNQVVSNEIGARQDADGNLQAQADWQGQVLSTTQNMAGNTRQDVESLTGRVDEYGTRLDGFGGRLQDVENKQREQTEINRALNQFVNDTNIQLGELEVGLSGVQNEVDHVHRGLSRLRPNGTTVGGDGTNGNGTQTGGRISIYPVQ